MENIEFSNACYEVLEILKYIKAEDLLKIPKEEIQILKNNANYKHNFTYDCKKAVKEQEISKMAKGIIAVYFYKYTASEKQKEKIRLKQEYDLKLKQEANYSYNEMFNRRTKQKPAITNTDTQFKLIEYKSEKWYMIVINKIKKLFNSLLGK